MFVQGYSLMDWLLVWHLMALDSGATYRSIYVGLVCQLSFLMAVVLSYITSFCLDILILSCHLDMNILSRKYDIMLTGDYSVQIVTAPI